MSINRIQKLLFSEYCDFEDMVLVESPFAETTRDGKGLRQVHLGLTPSKLVLATDVLPLANSSSVSYTSGVDPDIETFELIAVYPIECVSLSVFHRRKRQSLKARFCNNKVLYFELGGYEKRKMFWNLWCEKVKFLNPDNPNSSHSETSVATSTTNSTLYLVSSKRFIDGSGNSQLWCKFATGDFMRVGISWDIDKGAKLLKLQTNPAKWTDKYLYLGKHLEESPLKYAPCQNPITVEQFVKRREEKCEEKHRKVLVTPSNLTTNGLAAINRFSTNVNENCSTALFLPAENVIVNAKFNNSTTQSTDMFTMYNALANRDADLCEMAESAVRIWEFYKVTPSSISARGKHRRRYALTPQPHFFHGLGPWNVNQGERFSLQMKRAVSVVAIKRQPVEPELRLSVSRRQLIASISCEVLQGNEKLINFNNNTIRIPPKSPMIFFWTPEYWYRPRTARDTYQELQTHLRKIHDYHQFKDSVQIAKRTQRHRRKSDSDSTDSEDDEATRKNRRSKKRHLLNKLKPITKKVSEISDKDSFPKEKKETSIQALKRLLRMEVSLTAWDFDSNTLAFQLTLIDRDLFLKITPSELGVLVWQQSSKNAPNVGALIAFSHRISCLIATEILKDDSEKIRARLVARFICAADKCYRISNFQSCRSLLCGLQSPPVYRLYSMWTYVRKRHSSKYQTFEKLCRLYRDPRLSIYQKTFLTATKTAPYLPFIGDLIDRLLDRIPDYQPKRSSTVKTPMKQEKADPVRSPAKKEEAPSLIKKLLSTLKVWHVESKSSVHLTTSITESLEQTAGLGDDFAGYYGSLDRIEDNRQRRLDECVAALEKYQRAAANYTYSSNELAREYLLKARYREDKDNFMHSFNVEPPLQFER